MKKIKFASSIEYMTFPVVGAEILPDWYRKHPLTVDGSKLPLNESNQSNATFKKCMPVFDSFMSGFFAVLESDIQITQKNGSAYLQWSSDNDPVSLRDGTHMNAAVVPSGYSEKAWVWLNKVVFELPPGYSAIITHPMNRFDLPFITMSAIIDADTVVHEGKIPFFLKDGYEGIVKRGTPIFQIIPFRREAWRSEQDVDLIKKAKKNVYMLRSTISGWYKKNSWNKKIFIDGANNEKN